MHAILVEMTKVSKINSYEKYPLSNRKQHAINNAHIEKHQWSMLTCLSSAGNKGVVIRTALKLDRYLEASGDSSLG